LVHDDVPAEVKVKLTKAYIKHASGQVFKADVFASALSPGSDTEASGQSDISSRILLQLRNIRPRKSQAAALPAMAVQQEPA